MKENLTQGHCFECITRLKLFEPLSEEEFSFLNSNRCKVFFRQGETLFKQGTAMTHILIITHGLVKIYIEGIAHHNLLLELVRPVNLIYGPGLFTDFKHYHTAVAVEDTHACFVETSRFVELFSTNKVFAENLVKNSNLMTQRLYHKMIELTQMGMHGRIASALLYLNSEVYTDSGGNIKIQRQDLADLTGMTKESSIRILKEFKDAHIISVRENLIFINDLDRLKEISIKG